MSLNNHSHYTEDAFVTDANFKVEINKKMKVPDKISFGSDPHSDNLTWTREDLGMNVPERILVAGHHQHVGTKAPPPEIAFDNSLLASEPYPQDLPRVATPPRILTLDKYPFASAEDQEETESEYISVAPNSKIRPKDNDPISHSFLESSRSVLVNEGGGLTSAEEVLHLRKQMAKLNRRVMSLELENMNRLQKEKVVVGFGIAYFLLKLIIWMNKE